MNQLCKLCGHRHSTRIKHILRTVEGTTPEYVKAVKKSVGPQMTATEVNRRNKEYWASFKPNVY